MKNLFKYIFFMVGWASATVSAQDNPNIFTYRLGTVEVSLLSEGQNTGNSDVFVGATPEMIGECLPNGTFPRSCNAFLIRMSGKNILVDTGFGRQLFDNLKSLGIAPEQIDAVLLTHMHGDHIGGMFLGEKAAFPNAELYLAKPEHDYWMGNDARNANARRIIEAYRSKLRLVEPNEIDGQPTVLFPGIQAVAAYGHTPGHTMFMVVSGNERLLIWGDLTHAMAIQMPYPQVAMSYDVNPDMAIASRKKALEYVAKNNVPVAGMHTAFPGMGKITKTAEGKYSNTPLTK